MPRNDLAGKFGTWVKCNVCGAFLQVKTEKTELDHQDLSGTLTVTVTCKKCGFKESGLRIDYNAT